MIHITTALVKISCISDRLIPLGLACLQAYLKMHSMGVKVFNFRTDLYTLPKIASDPLIQLKPPRFIMNHQDFPITIPLAECFLSYGIVDFNEGIFPDIIEDYARRLYETPEVTQKRFESMVSYIKEKIRALSYSYSPIAFSLDYLNIVETVIASALLKHYDPHIQIIWGGPTITQSSDAFRLFLQKGICDGLVVGEGENPLLWVSRGVPLKQVQGVISKKSKTEVYFKPGIQLDINSLPTPDYTDLPLDTYYNIASVYRSRGCTHRCQFCAEWRLFGRRFRVRSVENVVHDIETIIDAHHPKYMIFGESLVNDSLDYFEKLCENMIEKHFDIKFGTHFRANITPQLAQKAVQAGFNDAWVGFEAFSDTDLKQMNKGTNVNQNIATIKTLTQAGINVIAMLVVGFSTIEEEQKNCENILKIIDYFSSVKRMDESGKITPISIQWRPSPMYIVPGSFDYDQKKSTHTWSWKCSIISDENIPLITALESELSSIPYEFERPISDAMVGTFMKRIQERDRNAGFTIGGIAQHVINHMMNARRQNRKNKKNDEKIGIIAQRFNKTQLKVQN
ncbi:MAG: B12-binding domain-containing radical SAM protein [Promethearchaeota archaeon]